MIKFKYISNRAVKATGEFEKILPCLEYRTQSWWKGQYGKQHKEKKRHLASIGSKNCVFLSGLLPRITDYCKERGVSFEISGALGRLSGYEYCGLTGIDLDHDQRRALRRVRRRQNGVIYFPTGSGKTVIAGAIISSYSNARVLFLCHTKEILGQTYDRFKNSYGFNTGALGGGFKDDFKRHRVFVATIQSFIKMSEYENYFDIVIVDEAHHISSLNTQYAKVLIKIRSRMRIGLTGTLPEKDISKLALEGLIGPTICELSAKDAMEKGILAKPILDLIPVPYNTSIASLRKYDEIYKQGVVYNRTRNKLIVERAQRTVDAGMSVLIIVREIEHGREIYRITKLVGLHCRFIHGRTDSVDRNRIRRLLERKKYQCIIASMIWKEGVDIPTLDHIINAFGGKGEVPTVQVPGRGARSDRGRKSHFLVTDCLDPYHHLAQHTVRRLQIYLERGWLQLKEEQYVTKTRRDKKAKTSRKKLSVHMHPMRKRVYKKTG